MNYHEIKSCETSFIFHVCDSPRKEILGRKESSLRTFTSVRDCKHRKRKCFWLFVVGMKMLSRVFLARAFFSSFPFPLSLSPLTNRKSRKKPERCIKISAAYNLGRKIIFNILMHVSDAMMRQSYSLDMNPFIFSSDFRQTFKFSPRGIVTRRGGSEG